MTDFILKSPKIRNMLQLMTTLKLDTGNKLVCNCWDPARKKNVFSLLMWLSGAKYLNLTYGTIKAFELVKTSNEKASY